MPELVAHRGYAARYPENTLAAQRAALTGGIRWVECDVQLSADRVPVVIHDADLLRTAGDPRAVFDLTAEELSRTSVHEPLRLGRAHEPEWLPRLADSIALLDAYPHATLFVEVKHESIERFGLDAVMDAVYAAIAPAGERCVVISFDDAAVAHAIVAGHRAGWVLPHWNDAARAVAESLAPEFLFTNIKRVPAGVELWPGPWRWAAYDARTADEALVIAARGFELVETKAVGELLLDPRVAAWLKP